MNGNIDMAENIITLYETKNSIGEEGEREYVKNDKKLGVLYSCECACFWKHRFNLCNEYGNAGKDCGGIKRTGDRR